MSSRKHKTRKADQVHESPGTPEADTMNKRQHHSFRYQALSNPDEDITSAGARLLRSQPRNMFIAHRRHRARKKRTLPGPILPLG
jgi:hypothetical protein